MFGQSNATEPSFLPQQRPIAILFVVGLALSAVAVGALLELRNGMLSELDALATLNALQADRAGTMAYLAQAPDEAPGNAPSLASPLDGERGTRRALLDALDGLEAKVRRLPDLEPVVRGYVASARASLARENSASPDFGGARRSMEGLDAVLSERTVEGNAELHHDIAKMAFALAALIAGIALTGFSQAWKLVAIRRRWIVARSDSASKIESPASSLGRSPDTLDVINGRLTLSMRSAHVVAFRIEPSGNVTWANDDGGGVFGGSKTPFLLSTFAPEADRARIQKHVLDASRSGNVAEFEMRVEQGDLDLRWVKVTLLPLQVDGGSEMLGSLADVTAMKRREEGNVLLMRELSHRSKNLLAIVQAMARQTARTAGSPVEFYERFGARLRALAAGHDLLVETVYTSAEFGELIMSQIGALAGLIGSRVFIQGPKVHLRPEATQNLGMALHELAANAQIHGAMTHPGGRLDIGWKLEGSGPDGRLIVDWIESKGPNVAPSDRRGFGSTLILENLPRSLHGVVTLDYLPEGVRCHMDLPFKYTLESFKADESAGETSEPSIA